MSPEGWKGREGQNLKKGTKNARGDKPGDEEGRSKLERPNIEKGKKGELTPP